jgi:hypothetical protein
MLNEECVGSGGVGSGGWTSVERSSLLVLFQYSVPQLAAKDWAICSLRE